MKYYDMALNFIVFFLEYSSDNFKNNRVERNI